MLAHVALLGASAVLLGLAFPTVGVPWLAHWALVPAVVLAVRASSARRLAWTSWVVFTLWWLVMGRWLAMVTVGGYIAVCMLMAGYMMAALQLTRWLDRRHGLPMVAALPLAWVSVEFVRGQFLAGGFGWFVLAHTQAPFRDGQLAGRLIQVADLFGEHTVGLLVAMTNGLLADLILRRWTHISRSGRPRLGNALPTATLLWAAVMAGAWFYGSMRLAVSDLPRGPVVAVVQTNVPQDNRNPRTAQQHAADWAELLQLTFEAADAAPLPDLIVWPETVVPLPLNPEARSVYLDSEAVEGTIQNLARQVRSHLVVGGDAEFDFRAVELPDGRDVWLAGRRHNSAYLYYADGGAGGRYDKMHRVPFGEYIPWVDSWPAVKRLFVRLFSPWGYDWTIQPGRDMVRFTVPVLMREDGGDMPATDIVRLATPICFEDAIPRVCRRMVYDADGRKAADMLVNLTNDGWYPGTPQQAQHLQIATLRCVENRVPMARAVNTGISGFIDSMGHVGPLIHVDGRRTLVAGSVRHAMRLDPRQTWFGYWGEWPMWLLTAGTAALAAAGALRRGHRSHHA